MARFVVSNDEQLDITAPDHGVEVQIRHDGTVLWVNVDGKNVLRVCRIPGGRLEVQDNRLPEKSDNAY